MDFKDSEMCSNQRNKLIKSTINESINFKKNINIVIYKNTTQTKSTLLKKGLGKTEIQTNDFC